MDQNGNFWEVETDGEREGGVHEIEKEGGEGEGGEVNCCNFLQSINLIS